MKSAVCKCQSAVDFARDYVKRLTDLLNGLNFEEIDKVVQVLIDAKDRGATIFFLGNGGSAATASHFANDMGVCASPEGKKPFRAISLASNMAHVTCLGNDMGYENIFAGQLRNLMRPGDIVVAISASGNSPNAVKALEYANQHGGTSVAIVGFFGGVMKRKAHHVIHVKSETGEYGPVEDVHMALDHLISTYLAQV
ncbi:MAG: D-sedoheptulose-7-phosphate isomerase [Desulfomonilaceae bacterium]